MAENFQNRTLVGADRVLVIEAFMKMSMHFVRTGLQNQDKELIALGAIMTTLAGSVQKDLVCALASELEKFTKSQQERIELIKETAKNN